MALPTIAAPSRPAPMPQPRPGPPPPPPPPPACAWVVVEARLPVTASVARARAAILVLIDMRNSIRLHAARLVRMPSWTERLRIRFDPRVGHSEFRLFPCNHR